MKVGKVKCPCCKARFKWLHVCNNCPGYKNGVGITREFVLYRKRKKVELQAT